MYISMSKTIYSTKLIANQFLIIYISSSDILFVCHTLYRNSDVFILCRLLSVSSQVMESFVAHMCLIHPLLEGCKMRVAMDLAQLELVLSLFCRGNVASLGHPYKMLQALRLVTHKYCSVSPCFLYRSIYTI